MEKKILKKEDVMAFIAVALEITTMAVAVFTIIKSHIGNSEVLK